MCRAPAILSFGIAAVCLSLAPVYAAPPVHVPPPHPQAAIVHAPPTHPTPPTQVKAQLPAKTEPAVTAAPPTGATIAARITLHPQLATRLQPLLPAGTTLAQAADGFRDQGQLIAALHVSHNLNIPFDELKAAMTGTGHDSLGQAIHSLKPSTDAKAAVETAEDETQTDLAATGRKTTSHGSGR